MKRSVRLMVPALTCLLLATLTLGVSAECMNVPVGANDDLRVGAAFLASVTEASGDVDPNPEGNPWEWHLELQTEATYLGTVPKTLSFNGYDGSCADLKGEALNTGDRVIIAVEKLPLSYLPGAPFEGHFVIWRESEDGWSFFEDALAFGTAPEYYPKAARDATTKSEILQLISSGLLPSTAVEPSPSRPDLPDPWPIATLAFVAALAFGLRRFRGAPQVGSRDIARR